MDIKKILAAVDHTLLSTTATFDEVKEIIDDGIKFNVASVCIAPCFVRKAAAYAQGKVKICTVIGFPNGYATTASKVYEAWDAVFGGADEIDMVINQSMVKNNELDQIIKEVNAVKNACGDKLLKVIIETCLLTDEEIIAISKAISKSNADFIKTSTGFSTEGATFKAVELMASNCTKKIKAAGGISSLADAEKFMALGAARLGTSRVVKIIKSGENNGEQGAY